MPITTPSDAKAELGQPESTLETPVVVVDLDAMDHNLRDFVAFAEEHDVRLRSHVKTHKIPDLANLQDRATGGGGIVCQTLSEAEVMAQNGQNDIYLSYMVVTERKLDRLVWLSKKLDRFATTVDGPGNIHPLQDAAERHGTTVDVVLELDVGLERVGVGLGEPAVAMAELVDRQPNLRLTGVMAFEGHVNRIADSETEYEQYCRDAMDDVARTVELIEAAGIEVDEVKVGSTGTSKYSGQHPIVTEINPGMYLFNDTGQLHRVDEDDCALTVLSTVISKPTEDRIVVDAGSKTMSMDVDRRPQAKHVEGLEYYNYSEEHGWVDTSACDERFSVGDRIEFIVPHVCTTVNLHDTLVGLRDGRIAEVWDVQARGKVT